MEPPGNCQAGQAGALWSAIVRTARDAIVAIDGRGRITCFNPAAERTFGYSAEEVLGRNVSVLMPEPYRSEHDGYIERYARTGERHAIDRVRLVQAMDAGGRLFPVELSVAEAEVNGEPVYTAVVRDVERTQRRYRAMLETSAVMIVVLTPSLEIVEFNGEAERTLGRSRGEVLNRGYLAHCVPEDARDRVEAALRSVIEGGELRGFEGPVACADGSIRDVLWNATPILEGAANPIGLVAVGSDITQRKAAERALLHAHDDLQRAHRQLREEQLKIVQAEKLSSIGQLASGVAHEVNNPLAGIKSCLEALKSGSLAEGRRHAYFDAIEDGLERMERIVRALLDYARPRQEATGHVDLHEVVSSCLLLVRPRQQKAGVESLIEFEPGALMVRGDRHQLMQAVMNVLINALHAAPKGSAVRVFGDSQGSRVHLCVADEGPGIAPEDLGKVTDPFFTTKPEGEGTGLGLAVTHGIVSRHDGELRIRSTPGEGTEVELVLPSA